MSRRKQIEMTEQEVREFLDASRTIIINSIGRDGVPHPMPMWFGMDDDGAVVMTTFAKSQKILNLERDPRVSLLAEAGGQYAELRGVVLYGKAELLRDQDAILGILEKVAQRSGGAGDAPAEAIREGLRRTAAKRVGIRIAPEKVVSWDHRKLAGVY